GFEVCGVFRIRPWPATFNVRDAEEVKLSRQCELVRKAQVHAQGLTTVAQGGVVDFDATSACAVCRRKRHYRGCLEQVPRASKERGTKMQCVVQREAAAPSRSTPSKAANWPSSRSRSKAVSAKSRVRASSER